MKRVTIVVLCTALAGCATAIHPLSPLGRRVSVAPDRMSEGITGELLAVSADSIWLARSAENVSIPLSETGRVRVRLAGAGGSSAITYSLLVGVLSGVALLIACDQVEGTECGIVLPAVAASSLLWGGLAALSFESSSTKLFRSAEWELIRAYARYPQGLPADVARQPLATARP